MSRRPPVARLHLEILEDRLVPTQSPFFLDLNHDLHAATSNLGDFVNNGGSSAFHLSGSPFSVGLHNGNQFAVLLTNEHSAIIFEQNTRTSIPLDNALQVAAGHDEVFIRDLDSRVLIYNLNTRSVTDTEAFSTDLSVGQVTLTIPPGPDAPPNTPPTIQVSDVLALRDGNNRVYVYGPRLEMISPLTIAAVTHLTDTGAYALQTAVGYQGEVFFRDGINEVFVYNNQTRTLTNTNAFAVDLSVGLDQNNNDVLAIRDGINGVHVYTFGQNAHWTDTGGFATQLAAGWGEIFGLDGTNHMTIYSTSTGQTTTTNGIGTLVRVTTPSMTGLDQVVLLDGGNRLYLYQGTFVDEEVVVVDVRGATERAT